MCNKHSLLGILKIIDVIWRDICVVCGDFVITLGPLEGNVSMVQALTVTTWKFDSVQQLTTLEPPVVESTGGPRVPCCATVTPHTHRIPLESL